MAKTQRKRERIYGMKRLFVFCLAALFCVTACAAPAAPAAPAEAAETAEAAVSAKGFALGKPIGAGEFEERLAQEGKFVVYFQGKKLSENEERLQRTLAPVTEEYADLLLCDYYTMPIDAYKEAQRLLGGNLFGVVLFEKGAGTVLAGDSLGDIDSAFNSFFVYELIAPDDHGLPMVDFAEVMERVESGEPFIVYIGRDTCPQCRLFAPNLEAALVERGLKTPIVYFNIEEYYRAQKLGLEGSEGRFLEVTSALNINSTPSLFYYEDGLCMSFDNFNNLFPELAKSQEEFDESNRLCQMALENWIRDYGIE